jgi:hypothetical protein
MALGLSAAWGERCFDTPEIYFRPRMKIVFVIAN